MTDESTEDRGDAVDLNAIRSYYEEKLSRHGPTARGVDWNSEASQRLRFEQFLPLVEECVDGSLIDFGCGYGALLSFVRDAGFEGRYIGVDLSQEMLGATQSLYADDDASEFVDSLPTDFRADWLVASGVFHVKLETDDAAWQRHVERHLRAFYDRVDHGFAVNFLTAYVDVGPERLGHHLYYAQPEELFGYCVRNLSRLVTLKHDYPLYEFTLIVRRDQGAAP